MTAETMSHTAVYDILDRIKQLPEEERLLLDDLLAQEEERQWRLESAEARRIAEENGVDQERIVRTVPGAAAVNPGGTGAFR
jgi:hypothetical protein